MGYMDIYKSWIENPLIDDATKNELRGIAGDEKEIEDRFYKALEFGTAGLRGIVGAGTNRMNKYTLSMAAQGFANYIKLMNPEKANLSIAIARDTRRMSDMFEVFCAEVMAANGIKAYIFEGIRSTPELSFAVYNLDCDGGAVITASHNPAPYNGFKVYGRDGCQLVDELAGKVMAEVEKVTDISMVRSMSLEEAKKAGMVVVLGSEADNAYTDAAMSCLQNLKVLKEMKDNLKVVYTPLHGTGGRPVQLMLSRAGFDSLIVVKEQMIADSEFTTAKSPNPEELSAFDLAIKYANDNNADMIIATDPDADRVGIAVKTGDSFRVLSGNETGSLLLEYVATTYKLPEKPAVVSTIVTSNIASDICKANGIDFYLTLTGFKYIGEKIAQFKGELQDLYGKELIGKNNFVMGYEESFGYLIGTHARDKDAVIATTLILEMYAYYMKKGIGLVEQLDNIYKKYGYYSEGQKSINLAGKEGMEEMAVIMQKLRDETKDSFAGYKVAEKIDYKGGYKDLRPANVVKYVFEDGSWFAVRPSGTEPKIKVYFSVKDASSQASIAKMDAIREDVLAYVKK